MRISSLWRPLLAGASVLAACARDDSPITAPRSAPSFAARGGGGATAGSAVDVSRDTTSQNETPVAVNPRDADNILTAANDWNYNDGIAYNVSFDGGRTWSATLPDGFVPALTRFTNDPAVPGTGFYDAAGDPAVAFGPDGTAYLAAQAFNFTSPFQIALYVTRSTDGGRTWADGVRQKPVAVSVWNGNGKAKGSEGQFPDHESIAVDNNPGSPFFGSVYVTWVQFNGLSGHSPVQVAFSRDGARTFSTPVQVTQGPIRNNQDARIAIGPDGGLYLTFDNGIQGGKGTANYVAVSRDGGRSWSTPVVFFVYHNPVCLFPSFCFNISGGAFRGPGSYPAPAFDASRNRLVVAFTDIDVDGRAKAYVTSAPAAGVSDPAQWSAPVALVGAGDRFGAELSVAPDGRWDLMFDDRSYSGNALVDVTYATSADGGATWSAARVSTAGFDASQYGVPCGSCAGGIRPFLGDYNGIASLAGRAVLTWTGVAPKTGAANDNLEIFFGSGAP